MRATTCFGVMAGPVPAIPIDGHCDLPDRDRRDKPGDDAASFAPVTTPWVKLFEKTVERARTSHDPLDAGEMAARVRNAAQRLAGRLDRNGHVKGVGVHN